MNVFAINNAALNDSNEIWSWDGTADLVVQADGSLITGLTGIGSANMVLTADGSLITGLTGNGTADIVLTTSLAPALQIAIQGTADMAWQASADSLFGVSGSGDAQLVVTAAGQGTRWTFGASDLSAVFQADGDGQAVAPVSVSFIVQLDAALDGRAATAPQGIADLQLVLAASLEHHVASPIYLEGNAPIGWGMEATPYMQLHSSSGSASAAWAASMDTRLGGTLYGEGAATLQLIATGEAMQWAYKFAEGAVVIELNAVAERHGKPTLPVEFIAAPANRAMHLGGEHRAFTVPAERRA